MWAVGESWDVVGRGSKSRKVASAVGGEMAVFQKCVTWAAKLAVNSVWNCQLRHQWHAPWRFVKDWSSLQRFLTLHRTGETC